MIRRPLNERFADKVMLGVKNTTIRDNPWPVGKPIMLFRWEGKPYRSKQVEIAPVIVEEVQPIEIDMPEFGEPAYFPRKLDCGCPLWISEGFKDQDDMDSWFSRVVKTGQTATKVLMRFRLATCHEVVMDSQPVRSWHKPNPHSTLP